MTFFRWPLPSCLCCFIGGPFSFLPLYYYFSCFHADHRGKCKYSSLGFCTRLYLYVFCFLRERGERMSACVYKRELIPGFFGLIFSSHKFECVDRLVSLLVSDCHGPKGSERPGYVGSTCASYVAPLGLVSEGPPDMIHHISGYCGYWLHEYVKKTSYIPIVLCMTDAVFKLGFSR